MMLGNLNPIRQEYDASKRNLLLIALPNLRHPSVQLIENDDNPCANLPPSDCQDKGGDLEVKN